MIVLLLVVSVVVLDGGGVLLVHSVQVVLHHDGAELGPRPPQLPHEDRHQDKDENQEHADGGVDDDAGEVLCLIVAEISDILRNFGNDREGGIICFFELDI